MNTVIETIGKEAMKENISAFNVGDTVKVHIKFKEITRGGTDANKSKNARADKSVKEEIKSQTFEGLVIARRGGGISETFTVRKISYGVGVEKTFMLHSPQIESIQVVRKGAVRRSKLYYMRGRTGKAAKVCSCSLRRRTCRTSSMCHHVPVSVNRGCSLLSPDRWRMPTVHPSREHVLRHPSCYRCPWHEGSSLRCQPHEQRSLKR